MLSKLLQVTKAVGHVVTLALILQLGGLGCALGCAKAATVINQDERHASTLSSTPTTTAASASFSAEHACCHSSTSARRETVSSEFVKIAEPMPCCLLASQMALPAIKQRAITDKALALTKEKVSTSFHVEFRAMPLVGQTRLSDRGGTFLRCCALLI